MRPVLACLLLAAAPLAGCGLFGPERVTALRLERVVVEALDLGRPWDSPDGTDRPDVYVHVKGLGVALPDLYDTRFRPDPVADVGPTDLPLVFAVTGAPSAAVLPLGDSLSVDVSDEDSFGGDDLMYRTERFTVGDSYSEQEVGRRGTVTLTDGTSRVRLEGTWE